MEWYISLLIVFGGLMLLMFTGLPVAFCFLIVNVIGVYFLWGGTQGWEQLVYSMWQSISSFIFVPAVAFVLMGELMFRSGIAMRAVDAMEKWMGRIPGRLGLVAVATSIMFAAMSGSPTATTAMLGEVFTPEMEKRGYQRPISVGAVMGVGGLSMIIPPSTLAVVWGALAQVSVGAILIAGIIPGLLMGAVYATYIVGRSYIQKQLAPAYKLAPVPLLKKVSEFAKYVLPLGLIVFMVTGTIIAGIATPSEAAVMGVFANIILLLVYKKINFKILGEACVSTARISILMMLIITGAAAFSNVVAYTGSIQALTNLVVSNSVHPIVFIVGSIIVIQFLGGFLNAVPIFMLTIPIMMPIVRTLGIDGVWFGFLCLLNIEMAELTPPFGIRLYVMKAVGPKDLTIGQVVKYGLPFLACDLLVLILVIICPDIALWLPSLGK